MGEWTGFASLRIDEWFCMKAILVDLVLGYLHSSEWTHLLKLSKSKVVFKKLDK